MINTGFNKKLVCWLLLLLFKKEYGSDSKNWNDDDDADFCEDVVGGEFLEVDGKDVDGIDGKRFVKRHEFNGHNSSSSLVIMLDDTGAGVGRSLFTFVVSFWFNSWLLWFSSSSSSSSIQINVDFLSFFEFLDSEIALLTFIFVSISFEFEFVLWLSFWKKSLKLKFWNDVDLDVVNVDNDNNDDDDNIRRCLVVYCIGVGWLYSRILEVDGIPKGKSCNEVTKERSIDANTSPTSIKEILLPEFDFMI